MHRGNVDDGSALLPLHVGDCKLATKPHATQIYGRQPVKFLLSRICDRLDQTDCGTVHQYVQPSSLLRNSFNNGLDVARLADVAPENGGTTAGPFNATAHNFRSLDIDFQDRDKSPPAR
jgi:hypothetical protein